MANKKERTSLEATSMNSRHQQIFSSDLRLSRLHRLFKNQFNVTEPSLILEPYLYLGNCISAQDIYQLAKLGIRYILNVAIRDVELCPYYTNDIRVQTIDLRDDDRENILRIFDQAFTFIDDAKRNKSRVLVHCSHGQSRSPAIVIGYLMRTYKVSLEQCLIHVIKARPCVSPNDGFLRQLILFDRFLVDQRRQSEQAAAASKATEISIPNSSVDVATLPEQAKSSMNTVTEESISNPTSTSTINSFSDNSSYQRPTSASNESIYIIPAQATSVKSFESDKLPPSSIKKFSTTERNLADDNKLELDRSVEKSKTKNKSTLDVSLRNLNDDLSRVSMTHTTNPTGRSKSAHQERSRSHQHHYLAPFNLLTQKDRPYYYMNYQTPNVQSTKTKYITEIYDRATNRFISV